jgi:hypothetical protein
MIFKDFFSSIYFISYRIHRAFFTFGGKDFLACLPVVGEGLHVIGDGLHLVVHNHETVEHLSNKRAPVEFSFNLQSLIYFTIRFADNIRKTSLLMKFEF